MWRATLSAVLGGLILGLIVGVVLGIVGADAAAIQMVAFFSGAILGICVNVFFFKKIIGNKFKDFTLVLVKTEQQPNVAIAGSNNV